MQIPFFVLKEVYLQFRDMWRKVDVMAWTPEKEANSKGGVSFIAPGSYLVEYSTAKIFMILGSCNVLALKNYYAFYVISLSYCENHLVWKSEHLDSERCITAYSYFFYAAVINILTKRELSEEKFFFLSKGYNQLLR